MAALLIPRWEKSLALITLVLAVLEEKKEWFEEDFARPGLGLRRGVRAAAAVGGADRIHGSRRAVRVLSSSRRLQGLYSFVDLKRALVLPPSRCGPGNFSFPLIVKIQQAAHGVSRRSARRLLSAPSGPSTLRVGPAQPAVQPAVAHVRIRCRIRSCSCVGGLGSCAPTIAGRTCGAAS